MSLKWLCTKAVLKHTTSTAKPSMAALGTTHVTDIKTSVSDVRLLQELRRYTASAPGTRTCIEAHAALAHGLRHAAARVERREPSL